MKRSSLKPGMVVYSVTRQRMGNTTMTREAVHTVRILEVPEGVNYVVASWNGNRPTRCYDSQVKRWRLTPPKPKPRPFEAYATISGPPKPEPAQPRPDDADPLTYPARGGRDD